MKWNRETLTGQTKQHLIPFGDFLIHPDILADFQALQKAAAQAGFTLTIASSFRDFERQTWIWNNKFVGLRPIFDDMGNALDINTLNDEQKINAILRWSAMPGGSRHHWGTDVDVYAINCVPKGVSLQLESWEYLLGHQAPFFDWLQQNLSRFGFYFPYKEDKGGIAIEQWHISHRVTTHGLLQQLTPEVLKQVLESSEVKGKQLLISQLDEIYHRFIVNLSDT